LGYDHLLRETADTLNWSQKERIRCIWEDIFIPYPQSDLILTRIEELMERPRTLRPQDILLAGPPGNGKTALLQEYQKECARIESVHKTDVEEPKILLTGTAGNGKSAIQQECERRNPPHSEPDVEIKPVLRTTAPVSGGEGKLLSAILQQFGYENWGAGSVASKQNRVLNALECCGVQLVIIDDVNNMLYGGKKKSEALYAIRNISNYLRIPIVFAGNEQAKAVFSDEPSLTSRLELLELPLWTENKDYHKFLWELEATISLKQPSQLYKKGKAHLIFELSKYLDPEGRKGILVNTLKLVKTAAVTAISDGTEYITIQHLESAAKRGTWNLS